MKKDTDVAQRVAELDRERQEYFFRDVDRPSTRSVTSRSHQDPQLARANGRLRTAAWRNRVDRLRRPELRDVGMALLRALVTSPDLPHLSGPGLRILTAALTDLEGRGFDRQQIRFVCKRFRKSLLKAAPGES